MKIIDINGTERNAKEVFPDPDYPGYMRVQFRRHHEWYTYQEFVQFNPKLKHLVKKAPKVADDVVSVATSAGKDFIRDSSQKWKPNAYMGMFIWISRGPGEGQKRTVVKNTHNKATVDKPWDVKPGKTSQYVISYNIQEVKAMGNTMPVEDMKDLERKAVEIDRKRGIINKDLKYLKEDEV